MSNKKYISGRYYAQTDLGRVRINNEDRVAALTNARGNILLIVCDGMGGENKGDFAASMAINEISEAFQNKARFLNRFEARYWVSNILRKVNSHIYRHASLNPSFQGMGTTLTLCLIINDFYIVAQIGDSRLYSSRNRVFRQITEDQTYVQYLFKTKQITEEDLLIHPKRHVLLNALGVYPSLDLDIRIYPYMNETFLLCSDGLYNNIPFNDIKNIINCDDTPEQKATKLIRLANSNGGSDNIAIVLWEASK